MPQVFEMLMAVLMLSPVIMPVMNSWRFRLSRVSLVFSFRGFVNRAMPWNVASFSEASLFRSLKFLLVRSTAAKARTR